MITLGIETSCDDTAVSVIENDGKILSNVLTSQEVFHRDFGGIVPEIASRKHAELIGYTIVEALKLANISLRDIDLISVTKGPGLVGSLLVGLEAAKSLSFALDKPLIGVNHLEGHIYSLFLEGAPLYKQKDIFPLLILIVSGGHTELILMENFLIYKVLGRTRDDAAGEAIDKFARFLGYGYPGGPIVEKLGLEGDPNKYEFPNLTFKGSPYEFSFSGLKTAGVYFIQNHPDVVQNDLSNLAASFENALVRILVERTVRAATDFNVKGIGVVGGVSANKRLRETFANVSPINVYFPQKALSTDNAAMIALTGYLHYTIKGETSDLTLDAISRLEL
ncbi:tRNA (adenosine(37)-N6)-threonylcarbamoyltransferase complex transferase subunit TsaD [Caldisericum exile]|uniref:tRNA N6-adenosine threonylcarbamoyltransferase n=1 Tax=Caldisericum exile (strain DSM 21853 / NBRC 104410 / AZM16c01) TaxID=511051 RepID=A0A7U6GFC3_CALEA|nr:tRNA (adenosine(37)-N6)-threonylcarbamoyltransferase complex transferase subunit TsaD [Caldisericum exile]BAL81346.1 putative O-sialoglycoprotein endopeptidase [Caldisericum exile AZM16c01]